MKFLRQLLAHGAKALGSAAFSFALWTVWLALALLLAVQIYIASANEFAIPDFLLRQLETRLAASGLRATFSRTSFDPTGRVLVEDARISLPAFAEPVLTARAIYVRLRPLALAVGKFEPDEIRVVGAVATLPAPFTRSGGPEEIIRGCDAILEPAARALVVRQFNADIAGVAVTAQGTLPLPRRPEAPATNVLADFLAQRFPAVCRQASTIAAELAAVEQPTLRLELAPSESGAIGINVQVLARAITLTQPVAAHASGVRASTRLLLFGDRPPSHIELSADEVRLPGDAAVQGLHATVDGQWRAGTWQLDLRQAAITADRVTAAGVTTRSVAASVFPQPWPRLHAAVVTRFLDEPLALGVDTDLGERSARVRFSGALSPGVLDLISTRVGVNVRKYYDFDALTVDRAEAQFGAGWAFEKLTARVRVPRMNSYGVIMEDGRATVELDPRRFYSPDAFARVGANFARGTYEHDLKTHEYRFLLDGRLRPLAISEWFHEWWSDFFKQLDFTAAAPDASVDVRGFWREGHRSNVFVFADVAKPVVRGAAFERVRTRLFIRPAFYDALELNAWHTTGDAHGRFTLVADPETHDWRTLDLALDSTLDLKVATQLLGPAGAGSLAAFQLATPPQLKLRGTFAGPAAPAGAKDALRVEARTTGEFRFHQFPLRDASFVTTLDGDDIVIDDLKAAFAGGAVSGHARVWGADAQRRLGFDVALQDATLGQVATELQQFFAAQKGEPAPPPGKFVKEKANVRINFAASAEGLYRDALSYHGDGNALLRGAEIGEVPLLGTLSELLKFTALRFTEARSNFKIEGPKVVFPKVELRGANSAIDAHGEYALDRRTLDFNAKIYPFHESESIIKSVVGAVLTPLSSVFEVKLTGSLEKPEWALAIGPTQLLRALGEGGNETAAKSTTNQPAATPPAPEPAKAPEAQR